MQRNSQTKSPTIIPPIKIQVYTIMFALKETCRSQTIIFVTACMTLREFILPVCSSAHVHFHSFRSMCMGFTRTSDTCKAQGRGSCRLWGVAGMQSNSIHNLRSFVRDGDHRATQPDITTISLCTAFRPKRPQLSSRDPVVSSQRNIKQIRHKTCAIIYQ